MPPGRPVDAVNLFPRHGLDAGDSFFARYATYPPGHDRAGEVREGRLYVGIHGGGLGSVQTSQVRTFSVPLQAGRDLPERERDPYWTVMLFFNSLWELGTSLSLFPVGHPRLHEDHQTPARLPMERGPAAQ